MELSTLEIIRISYASLIVLSFVLSAIGGIESIVEDVDGILGVVQALLISAGIFAFIALVTSYLIPVVLGGLLSMMLSGIIVYFLRKSIVEAIKIPAPVNVYEEIYNKNLLLEALTDVAEGSKGSAICTVPGIGVKVVDVHALNDITDGDILYVKSIDNDTLYVRSKRSLIKENSHA